MFYLISFIDFSKYMLILNFLFLADDHGFCQLKGSC